MGRGLHLFKIQCNFIGIASLPRRLVRELDPPAPISVLVASPARVDTASVLCLLLLCVCTCCSLLRLPSRLLVADHAQPFAGHVQRPQAFRLPRPWRPPRRPASALPPAWPCRPAAAARHRPPLPCTPQYSGCGRPPPPPPSTGGGAAAPPPPRRRRRGRRPPPCLRSTRGTTRPSRWRFRWGR